MAVTTAAVIAASAAVAGTAVSYNAAKKNASAQRDANSANLAAQDEANRLNYQRWLESQGVGPDGNPVNTWLPRHLTMDPTAFAPQTRRFRKRGSAPAAPAAPAEGNIGNFAV